MAGNRGRLLLGCTMMLASSATAAARTAEEACDEGDARLCHRLGYAAAYGEGRDYDPTLALRLLQRACDLGERDACSDRASFVLLLRGRLQRQVEDCEQGSSDACSRGAQLAWLVKDVRLGASLDLKARVRPAGLADAGVAAPPAWTAAEEALAAASDAGAPSSPPLVASPVPASPPRREPLHELEQRALQQRQERLRHEAEVAEQAIAASAEPRATEAEPAPPPPPESPPPSRVQLWPPPTPEPERPQAPPAPPLNNKCIDDAAYERLRLVDATRDDPLAFKPSAVWLPPFFLSDAARSYTWAGLLYFNFVDFKLGEKTTLVPPFFLSHCSRESETVITPIFGSRRDAEGTARLFLTYFQRRDRLAQTDIFFPLVWSLRERETEDAAWHGWGTVFPLAWWGSNADGSHYAAAANFYWHDDGDAYDTGLVPLYFGGRSATGGYQVSPALFWSLRDGDDYSLLLPPLLTYHHHDATKSDTWAANVHVGTSANGWSFYLAPLLFAGVDGESRYAYAPPLFFWKSEGSDSTAVLANFYWHQSPTVTSAGLFPLYFAARWPEGGFDVQPLLFWSYRDGPRHALTLPLLLTRHQGDGETEETWAANVHVKTTTKGDVGVDVFPLFFSGFGPTSHHVFAPPLFYRWGENDVSTTIAGNFFWHQEGEARDVGIVPLYFQGRSEALDYDVSPALFWSFRRPTGHQLFLPPLLTYHQGTADEEETWVANAYYSDRPNGFTFNVFPLVWSGREGDAHHEAVAPLFFRWGDARETTTIAGPVYVHSEETKTDFGVAPLYFGSRGAELDYDVSPLLFWSIRERARHRLFLPPLLTYHQGTADEEETWVANAYYSSRPNGFTFNVFPLVWSGRDGDAHHEAVAPLFFRWGNARETTTIAGPVYVHSEETKTDFGVAPLYFGGRGRQIDYDVSPPLFWSLRGSTQRTLVVPALSLVNVADGQSDTTVFANSYWRSSAERFDLGIAPLYFGGRGPQSAYDVSPALFWSFRDGDEQTLFVPPLLTYFKSRSDGFSLAAFPLFFAGKKVDDQYDVAPPLWWHFKSPAEETAVLGPFFHHRGTGGGSAFGLLPFYAGGRAGDVQWDVAPPLFFRVDDGESQNVGLPPLFHYRETKETKLFVSPVAVHFSDDQRKATVAGGLYWNLEGPDMAARVVAPLWWDFKSKGSGTRLSTFFPLYWRYQKPEETTHVFLNLMISSGTTELGPSWSFHLFPFVDLVSYHPEHFLWQVLTGLVGHERQGDSERWRVAWFWTDPKKRE